jgi:hypothetical protein
VYRALPPGGKKEECIWTGPVLRPSAVLCDRLGGFVKIRDDDGDHAGRDGLAGELPF